MRSRHCTPAWVTRAKLCLKKKKTKTNKQTNKQTKNTQCKETKNLGKRLDKMLTRITSLEKNISDLMELENIAENFARHTQVSAVESTRQKKGYQR